MKKKLYIDGSFDEESTDKIKTQLQEIDSIKFVNINAKEKSVTATLRTQMKDEDIKEAIERIGDYNVDKIHDLD
ncbi:heavy-metal-associated domain-containing protein [Orenia metallireducens]|jgi:copper chaperone CopZ|uniref:Heavy-metal-associated domain-containing protein n=1 Tax=Orenia metallireducens TaxID=1413210 RepID=A0A285I9N8_9FIRM|nr:cation transporter [Orenia metallireducens]PRX22477.1 heavy-metal-associated domain-containing protein [Orenia metallireducens]SNY43681.1 Heavy-metal-associated domain-containing protein [Orenia metallireducens]